ncbi:MAG: type IV toxin-antitoxin system AbiEi family antitoxin [Gammaproteobacteria bacterium]
MTRQTFDAQLLATAIEQLQRQTGIRLNLIEQQAGMADEVIDAIIEVEGYAALRFVGCVKKWAPQANFGALVEQVRQLPGKGILVADHVNPAMADRLRALDIPFIDTAGNALINEKPLHVFIKGNRPARLPAIQSRGRAFKPGGLKIVHALFTQPELLNASYRDIAQAAGVALGTVGQVLQDLKLGGFLVEPGKMQRRLAQKKRLFDRWVEACLETLKPRLLVGRYTSDQADWWKAVDISQYNAVWGGEVAVAKTTRYMVPQKITVYIDQEGPSLLPSEMRLRKDDGGEIALYRMFWKYRGGDVADAMVVYADLLGSVDPRNIEVARVFYGEKLGQLMSN